ncbi:hypothetical protein [Escherichia coli]|uniref:hypothetical protein n=1 Tax=Escherichia coli TaxID=562 RepID=UPI002FCD12FD
MRDNGQALEETEERFQTVDGFAADYYYRCAVMAATLVRLGYSAGRTDGGAVTRQHDAGRF